MILIAGPCVIENERLCYEVASRLKDICGKYDVDFYFKSSFDKANRTSIHSFRGPGLEAGLDILQNIRNRLDVKVVTDIHEPYQAAYAAQVCDILQIPAFLCRQTDLLVEAAKTGKTINVKKAQFLSPKDMENVVIKLEESGNSDIMLCERGTSFGYNQLVVDMTSITEMKKFGYPVIFDATHSVQKPGGGGTTTSGNRSYVAPLAYASMAVGASGLFIETHPDPDNALSDGPNMVPIGDIEQIIKKSLEIKSCVEGL